MDRWLVRHVWVVYVVWRVQTAEPVRHLHFGDYGILVVVRVICVLAVG